MSGAGRLIGRWLGIGALAITACQSGGAGDPPADAGTADLPAHEAASAADAGEADVPGAGETDAAAWRPLFNGADFGGWDRYLGKPSAGESPLGLNNDPQGVYSVVVVDDEPAVRISGQTWGSLISQDEYCHFQLRGEYRWGTLLWPPLNYADSGIMYLSTGPLGAVNAGGNALSDPIGSGGFMVSMEFQVTPGDSGGMYNLGPISFQQTVRMLMPENAAPWNQFEIRVDADGVQHLLNGRVIARAAGFQLNWPGQASRPLTCGKLQLESEGAEIFFRRLEILPLP